jgi:hypothetical protein
LPPLLVPLLVPLVLVLAVLPLLFTVWFIRLLLTATAVVGATAVAATATAAAAEGIVPHKRKQQRDEGACCYECRQLIDPLRL